MADTPLTRPDLVTDAVKNVTTGATDAINEAGLSILVLADYIGTGSTPASGTLRDRLNDAETALEALPTLVESDARYVSSIPVAKTLPSGFGYPTAATPALSITVQDAGPEALSLGNPGFDADALFSFYHSGWQSWTKYYVGSPGSTPTPSDGNNGLSAAAPLSTFNRAITLINTSGAPGIVMLGTGVYPRQNGFGSPATIVPTQPIAWMAYNGPVEFGAFDLNATVTWSASPDATYTNCYTCTRGGAERIVNCAKRNEFGDFDEFLYVASPAICNVTPDSWTKVGSVNYLNRKDLLPPNNGTANGSTTPTGFNTRIYVNVPTYSVTFDATTKIKGMYFGAMPNTYHASTGAPSSWWGQCGGINASEGVFFINSTDVAPGVRTCLVFSKGIVSSSGGQTTGFTLKNGIAVNGLYGVFAVFDCLGRANGADGFNLHCTKPSSSVPMDWAAQSLMLVVNSAGYDNGRVGSQSNQFATNHDGTKMLVLGGDGWKCHGGTIGASGYSDSFRTKVCCIGTRVRDDQGDVVLGFSQGGVGFLCNGYTDMWLDGVKPVMPPGTVAYLALQSTAIINVKNEWPTLASRGGPGSIGSYTS